MSSAYSNSHLNSSLERKNVFSHDKLSFEHEDQALLNTIETVLTQRSRTTRKSMTRRFRVLKPVNLCKSSGTTSNSINVRCGLLNVRALKEKTLLIHDLITDHNLDLMALTETWQPHNTFVRLNEATPPSHVNHHLSHSTLSLNSRNMQTYS